MRARAISAPFPFAPFPFAGVSFPSLGASLGHGVWAAAAVLAAGSLASGCGGPSRGAPPPGDALDQIEAAQLFHYGNQLADSGDSIRAEQYLSAAMERGYPEVEVIPRLMVVCIEASRLSAALSYAEPYLERHDDDWALRLLVASLQMGLNRPGSARANLERVLDAQPDSPEAHYLTGVLFRDQFVDPTTANAHFTRYLELEPAGDHAGEARISIAGRYRAPRADEGEVPAGSSSGTAGSSATGSSATGSSSTGSSSTGSSSTGSSSTGSDPAAPDEPAPPGPRRLAPHDTGSTESPTGSPTTDPAPSGT